MTPPRGPITIRVRVPRAEVDADPAPPDGDECAVTIARWTDEGIVTVREARDAANHIYQEIQANADSMRAECNADGGYPVPERFWNFVRDTLQRGGRWFGEGGLARPRQHGNEYTWENLNLPREYADRLSAHERVMARRLADPTPLPHELAAVETVVTGLALEQVAATYGLSRRNEPGGDPETDDDLRARVQVPIRDAITRSRLRDRPPLDLVTGATGVALDRYAAVWGLARIPGESDERLRARYEARVHGRMFLYAEADPHDVAEEAATAEPRAFFDGDEGHRCPCPMCSPSPIGDVDRRVPEFAKPLAPLPDWLQKVDEVLADAPVDRARTCEPGCGISWRPGSCDPDCPNAPASPPPFTPTSRFVQIPIRWGPDQAGFGTVSFERRPGESDIEFGARVQAERGRLFPDREPT